MVMNSPPYIPIENLSKIDIYEDWDSDNPYGNLGEVVDETIERLSILSNRAILAYSIGCAYWVVYRYSSKEDINILLKYIEACFPCLFALSDRIPNELIQDEWTGPVRGPLQFSVFLIADTWYSGEFDVPAEQGAYSEKLVFYAIPREYNERALFLAWRKVILTRLERNYKRDVDNPDGMGVPLDILDPTVELEPNQYKQQMLSAILKIDKNNEFLCDLSDFDIHKFGQT